MTCRERLKQLFPDYESVIAYMVKNNCPEEYGIMDYSENCSQLSQTCSDCLDREIPEEKNETIPICNELKAMGVNAEKMNEAWQTLTGQIKDSGDRTEFETGAVRDMREGKGRCDLMPLEVVYNQLKLYKGNLANPIECICRFQECGDTGALYEAIHRFACSNDNWDTVFTMFLEVSKHYEEGAKKYGENNWQKGIPTWCYIDSAVRHYLKWLRGDKDEPHDRAFVWNLMCCIWEVDYREKKEDKS